MAQGNKSNGRAFGKISNSAAENKHKLQALACEVAMEVGIDCIDNLSIEVDIYRA